MIVYDTTHHRKLTASEVLKGFWEKTEKTIFS